MESPLQQLNLLLNQAYCHWRSSTLKWRDAQKYYSFLKKMQDASQNQIKAQLNTSFDIIKDEELKQDGFNLLKYNEIKIKAQNDEAITKKMTAIIDSTSVVIGYVNMNDQTMQDLLNIMNLIYSEQHKLKQI
jgi:ethanolamine utilization protein EutQ (cupin superfamily)